MRLIHPLRTMSACTGSNGNANLIISKTFEDKEQKSQLDFRAIKKLMDMQSL